MLTRWLALLSLACTVSAQEPELAAAVDLPTRKERRKAALELAKNDVSLDAWLLSMQGFLPRGRARPGTERVNVDLLVEGKRERTEITTFVPESYRSTKPAPLLLTLHGAGGDGRHEPARWRDTADALGMIVVSPSEAVEPGGYAFTLRERSSAMAVLRWARRQFNIDENRIHLTGISRGGHMTWDVGLRFFDRFASLSPMIGGPRLDTRKGQNNLRFIENAAALPIRDLQGEGDDPRMLFNLRLAFARLKNLRATDAKFITFEGMAHSFRMDAVDWKDFFTTSRRDPHTPRVVRLCASLRESRAHWVELLRTDRTVKERFLPKVSVDVWNALDDAGRRRHLQAEADKRTARLVVERKKPGEFVASGTGVKRFRLLLSRDMFVSGEAATVTWRGKTKKARVRSDKKVLLLDFVERFDRTLLPVAVITVP